MKLRVVRVSLASCVLLCSSCGGEEAVLLEANEDNTAPCAGTQCDSKLDCIPSCIGKCAGDDDGCRGVCTGPARSPAYDVRRTLAAFLWRPFDVHVPPACEAGETFPVVLVLHGGGGNSKNIMAQTCPDGDLTSPGCMNSLADRYGYVVVYPNGMLDSVLLGTRTFNAGGGINGYACISGAACQRNVDDIAYFRAVLADLPNVVAVQRSRVFAVGMSNGGAMSHRLACQLSEDIAGIASVGSTNQYAAVTACSPVKAIPVIAIHGDRDRFWPFQGGVGIGMNGRAVSAMDGISGWVVRNGCNPTAQFRALPDLDPTDGTYTLEYTYSGCSGDAEVVLLMVVGGGHTWPQGKLASNWLGLMSNDFSANETMLQFFGSH